MSMKRIQVDKLPPPPNPVEAVLGAIPPAPLRPATEREAPAPPQRLEPEAEATPPPTDPPQAAPEVGGPAAAPPPPEPRPQPRLARVKKGLYLDREDIQILQQESWRLQAAGERIQGNADISAIVRRLIRTHLPPLKR